ncbi:MAG: VOC family protein [Gammaproteobacteria bacterium]|nr:VOC family protein [Gammaproteobacteria bacterium]MDH3751313.1 VOC family protein [Gammaproteobacteria bacterium]MDH3804015.1 VOC family protein [Gammaproteobacteria bacterium]
MPPTRIHHVNFVVHDLEEAMARFERALGVEPFEIIDYRPRGARVARTRVGESWLVLVCPYDPASVPGRHLAEHGEGFFLISLGYEHIGQQLEQLEASGIEVVDQAPRDGILDWRVADIGELHSAKIQLTQDNPVDDEQD